MLKVLDKFTKFSLKLPQLNFGFNDLQPILSAKALEIHYLKHH